MTPYPLEDCAKNLARQILTQLQPVKTVKLGNWFVEILSAVETGGLSSYPLLNIKCLTLECPNFEHILGIVNVLHCSPLLERLVINQYQEPEDLDLNNFKETYLDSDGIAFTCLMLHLKTVKIVGLSEMDGQC
ncbi:hypothetical protein M5689_011485 [Euphorbia peplus]|nr:hypothetical protein M5689_011485 [Euphorbia peplus]